MRSRNERAARGAVRVELVVVGVLLTLLFGIFLQRVMDLQRDMEQAIVDAEVLNLRTDLLMEVASRIGRGEENRLGEWAGRNPLQLLGREQEGIPPTRSPGGAAMSSPWQWQAERGALVYRYTSGDTLGLRLARVPLAGRDGWALGGGLLLLRERGTGN